MLQKIGLALSARTVVQACSTLCVLGARQRLAFAGVLHAPRAHAADADADVGVEMPTDVDVMGCVGMTALRDQPAATREARRIKMLMRHARKAFAFSVVFDSVLPVFTAPPSR